MSPWISGQYTENLLTFQRCHYSVFPSLLAFPYFGKLATTQINITALIMLWTLSTFFTKIDKHVCFIFVLVAYWQHSDEIRNALIQLINILSDYLSFLKFHGLAAKTKYSLDSYNFFEHIAIESPRISWFYELYTYIHYKLFLYRLYLIVQLPIDPFFWVILTIDIL